MNDLKNLVEQIVEYTKDWSIPETEWYWNVDCKRKSATEEQITTEEFERAIREEILYDLVYDIHNIEAQIQNDCYWDWGDCSKDFNKASISLEKEIQKYYKDFKIERDE